MAPDITMRISDGPFWQLVQTVLVAGEEPLHLTHLKCVQGSNESVGTLFLTSQRLLWRSFDPNSPEGPAFDLRLGDIRAVDGAPQANGFRLATASGGGEVFFLPQYPDEATVLLCAQMAAQVRGTWAFHTSLGRTA